MSEWTWEWEGYDPAAERLREPLCTLSNGYFATRGAVRECRAGLVHYPGTYAAGCHNRLESTATGRQVVNEGLVNLPNWLLLRLRPRHDEGARRSGPPAHPRHPPRGHGGNPGPDPARPDGTSDAREDALWLDPVPLSALSEYGFSLRYRGHWGVGVRRRPGQLEIGVPDSEESPIREVLADRAVTIAPGETCTLVLPTS